MLAADLKSQAGFVCTDEGRRTPLIRFGVLDHGKTAATLKGEKETGLHAVEQNDSLGFVKDIGWDALFRLSLHPLELAGQRANAVIQRLLVTRNRGRSRHEQSQTCNK